MGIVSRLFFFSLVLLLTDTVDHFQDAAARSYASLTPVQPTVGKSTDTLTHGAKRLIGAVVTLTTQTLTVTFVVIVTPNNVTTSLINFCRLYL